MPRYLKVQWLHDFDRNPILLASELDDDRFEVRKVEIYRNGRHDFAEEGRETGSTGLGEVPVPQIGDINADSEFSAVQIDPEEFERLWRSALAYHNADDPS